MWWWWWTYTSEWAKVCYVLGCGIIIIGYLRVGVRGPNETLASRSGDCGFTSDWGVRNVQVPNSHHQHPISLCIVLHGAVQNPSSMYYILSKIVKYLVGHFVCGNCQSLKIKKPRRGQPKGLDSVARAISIGQSEFYSKPYNKEWQCKLGKLSDRLILVVQSTDIHSRGS